MNLFNNGFDGSMSIEKSIELYSIIINNLEKSNFGNNQVQIYKEIIEFISDCSTVSDANKKLKSSDYYIAPRIAFMKDQFETFKKANLEIEMPEIAKIYEDKVKEIVLDNDTAYETGHEHKANGIWTKHVNKIYAFLEIYKNYCYFIVADDEDYKLYHKYLINAFEKLNSLNADFLELSKDKKFRYMIPVNDQAYDNFIKNSQIYINSPPDFIHIDKNEFKIAWKNLKENKSKIKKIGETYFNVQKRSGAISISPKNEKW